ncbi:hypothetical protein G6F70_009052 [Rhizopus microsporus]|nr:hypothetical protein G6F71_007976 [Rhizopus microsporus]KAG1193529.1 hypothetical protein G6F70_009052 [Rhizopus microsporus]KAG1206156.1 hypothetical protein G6F69_009036 [Rhizopus microsporus]KAG1228053.1 hypothetical protein G6F67_008065 [Rhizopus microsporus]KAG1260282.1 hypothetical protein G6F68_007548 [Rhizopus microsporus]
MSNWRDLPAEILINIYRYLHSLKDVSQCQRTCKQWSKSAQLVLYERLTFSERHIDQFVQSIRSFPSDRTKLTKSIHFSLLYEERHYRNSRNYLLEISKLCPNVEEVSAFGAVPEFYRELACAAIFYWKNLKRVARPFINRFSLIDYSLCVFQLEHSIQQVAISRDFCMEGIGRDFLERLNHFPCLNKIVLMDPTKPKHLDDILQRVPTISALDLVSLEDFDEFRYDPSLVTPCPDVKSIEGLMLPADESIWSYVKDKFPALEYLEMTINLSGYERVKQDYFCGLLEHVQRIPKYHIQLLLPPFELTSLVLRYQRPVSLSLYMDFRQIDIIQKNAEGAPLIRIAYPTSMNEMEAILTEMQLKDNPNSNLKTKDIQVHQLLEHCGPGLERLSLKMARSVRSYENPLKDILRLCPILKELHYNVHALYEISLEDEKKLQASSIRSLSISTGSAEEEALLQLSILFPSLRRFRLSIGTLSSYQKNDCFILDMPSTSLEYLYLHLQDVPYSLNNSKYQNDPITVKIFTNSIDGKLYAMNNNTLQECFIHSMSPKLYIRCQDIQYISLKIGQQFATSSLLSI